MLQRRTILTVGVLTTLITACGDGGTGPQHSALVGTWHATKLRLTSIADPSRTLDYVATGGALTLLFRDDYTATTTYLNPDEAPTSDDWTWSQTGSALTMTGVGSNSQTWSFHASLSHGVLSLSGATVSWDFGHEDEPTRMDMTLTK
jgi:hypothetical protein